MTTVYFYIGDKALKMVVDLPMGATKEQARKAIADRIEIHKVVETDLTDGDIFDFLGIKRPI